MFENNRLRVGIKNSTNNNEARLDSTFIAGLQRPQRASRFCFTLFPCAHTITSDSLLEYWPEQYTNQHKAYTRHTVNNTAAAVKHFFLVRHSFILLIAVEVWTTSPRDFSLNSWKRNRNLFGTWTNLFGVENFCTRKSGWIKEKYKIDFWIVNLWICWIYWMFFLINLLTKSIRKQLKDLKWKSSYQ